MRYTVMVDNHQTCNVIIKTFWVVAIIGLQNLHSANAFWRRRPQTKEGQQSQMDIPLCSALGQTMSPTERPQGCWSACQKPCPQAVIHPMYRDDWVMEATGTDFLGCKGLKSDGQRQLCRARHRPGHGVRTELEEQDAFVKAAMTPESPFPESPTFRGPEPQNVLINPMKMSEGPLQQMTPGSMPQQMTQQHLIQPDSHQVQMPFPVYQQQEPILPHYPPLPQGSPVSQPHHLKRMPTGISSGKCCCNYLFLTGIGVLGSILLAQN